MQENAEVSARLLALSAPDAESPDEKLFKANAALTELETALEAGDPNFRTHLRTIDKILRSYPELTYLLAPEAIGTICKGLIHESDAMFFNTAKTGGGAGKAASVGSKKELKALIAAADDF